MGPFVLCSASLITPARGSHDCGHPAEAFEIAEGPWKWIMQRLWEEEARVFDAPRLVSFLSQKHETLTIIIFVSDSVKETVLDTLLWFYAKEFIWFFYNHAWIQIYTIYGYKFILSTNILFLFVSFIKAIC